MDPKAEQLADLIEKHPNAQFDIDNDMWYMLVPFDKVNPDDDNNHNEVTDSDKFAWSTDWYGHSSDYGAGIAEALIILLNRRGFSLVASAV